MAMLDHRADHLDRAAEELGEFFDHLRRVGIRGFIAEHTTDADFATLPESSSIVSDHAEASTDPPTNEPRDDPSADTAGAAPDRASTTEGSR